MYENVTYKGILGRMLDKVPNNIDKREGSIIYDALAPAAMEMMHMYIELNTIMSETFGDTASRDFLILRAKERGIVPYSATYAILKAVSKPNTINIKIGSRFSLDDLNYTITEKIKEGEYKAKCESLGTIGNRYFGSMIPIDYIDGLESIELTELLIPGEDEEDTEAFRLRYFSSFDSKAYGGNVEDYLKKTNVIAGVGSTKVTPIWNGGGTVKLTILDSNFDKANNVLIETVQEQIDPTKDGSGIGIAPIGHIVTVDTVEEIKINISTRIVFSDGKSFSGVKHEIEKIISDYLLEMRKNWANQDELIVRIAQIESRIISIGGVIDIVNTKINDSPNNLTLTKYQIPLMGDIVNEGS